MSSFEFATASRILFGPGVRREAALAAAGLGTRLLIVTGIIHPFLDELAQDLTRHGLTFANFQVNREPDISLVRTGIQFARQQDCDLVLGIGGGSALDVAKAIAAMLANPGDLLDYLEVIGKGKALEYLPAPVIALPTTAGTGSEVTRNAVLGSPEHKVKVSLRSPHMLPRLALVDPELTLGLPAEQTASTGLDALTQLIEPYVSSRANPLTDGFCLSGLARVARSLRLVVSDGNDLEARTDMSLASLFGGLALANAGLGAVHGFAAPLGGIYAAPHGAICARLLPLVMEANLGALRQRQPDHFAVSRYAEIARILVGSDQARPEDGIAWVQALVADFQIPGLGRHGLTPQNIPEVVEKSQRASSMKANPVLLTPDELQDILIRAL